MLQRALQIPKLTNTQLLAPTEQWRHYDATVPAERRETRLRASSPPWCCPLPFPCPSPPSRGTSLFGSHTSRFARMSEHKLKT